MHIHDPSSGKSLAIDNYNRMRVAANIEARAAFIAKSSGAVYVAYGKHTIQTSATDENVLHMEVGNGQNLIKINKIVFSTNGVGSGKITKLEVRLDGTFTSGGRSVDCVQLNRTRKKLPNVSVLDNNNNDLVMATVGANEIADIRLSEGQATAFLFFEDSLILGSGNNIQIIVEGTSGDKVRAFMHFHEESPEDLGV